MDRCRPAGRHFIRGDFGRTIFHRGAGSSLPLLIALQLGLTDRCGAVHESHGDESNRSGGRELGMKKLGEFWVPDVDVCGIRNRFKSHRLFVRGRGAHVEDLERALTYVRKWSVAVDGGANVGTWTRVLAERFREVYAFEPAPDSYEALVHNVAAWGGGSVHTYPLALSDRAENVSLWTRRGRRSPSRQVRAGGRIRTVRIDDLGLSDLAFLKLDVEGYEERALRGAMETIARFHPVVMIEEKPVKNVQYGDPHGARKLLESLGAKTLVCIRGGHDWVYGF
jgi:FkbM family methyltransferase